MGFKRGKYTNYVLNKKVNSALMRIIRKAFGGSVYKMVELKRDY